METPNGLLPALCLSLLPTCTVPSADPGAGGGTADPAVTGRGAPRLSQPPDFVAWTQTGELALARGTTGVAYRHLALPGPDGARDVAWDPWNDRLIVAQATRDGQGGEITSVPLDRGRSGLAFGVAEHVAWIDGEARVLPTPAGPVVFERGYADRWRLLSSTPTAGVSAPPPASVWLAQGPDGPALHALGWEDGAPALTRRIAGVAAGGIALPAVTALSVDASTLPPTARLVPAPARGDAMLLDITGTSLAVRLVAGGTAGPATLVPLAGAERRVEGAVALHEGEVTVVLLSGGADPGATDGNGGAEVVAAAVGPSGGVWSCAHLPLPGAVAPASPYFSRDLAVQRDRVLVATSAGVLAVRVAYDGNGVRLSLARGFDGGALRGPIAVVGSPP